MQTNLQELKMTPHKLAQQLHMHVGETATLFPPAGQGENFKGKIVAVDYCERAARISVKLGSAATAAPGDAAPTEQAEKVITFDPSSVKIARCRDTTDRLQLWGAFGILAIEPAKRR